MSYPIFHLRLSCLFDSVMGIEVFAYLAALGCGCFRFFPSLITVFGVGHVPVG